MFSISYALKHIYRSFMKCFSMMSIVLAFILLFCYFSNSIRIQGEKLDFVYKTIPIYVEVSDYRGNNRDDLALPDGFYVETFTLEKYEMSNYLKDISLKRELSVLYFGNAENLNSINESFKIIGITNLSNVKNSYAERGFDFEIEFKEGLDYDIFKESSNLCLVSEELLISAEKKMGDMISLSLITKASIHSRKDEFGNITIRPVDAKFEIAGVIKGGKINEIYCSWGKAAELGALSDNCSTKYTDILRATINDNYKLNEFKAKAKKDYVSVGEKMFTGTKFYALTVYDDIFTKALTQIQRNIQFLKAVYPLVVVFSFVIGYLVSYLFTRNRKKEVAVMRSLGISRFKVFITIMIELTAINVIGTLLGIVICHYLLKINVTINEIALFLIANTLGAALSAIRISSGSVMAIMKDKE